ncbi:hypothetical protein QBC46DRAFT_413441 [Diplogelasinospora grovesii]|uniref:Uncharacterized protein n=1 Tax=Diplogelasinospora grovesii TaxID=303347 RepID=A0AAN6RZL8_9PEZI|nr:hypothetical protein QBC46DRAFT_413441 [Diplogelasinospora grovesii]
MTFAVQKNVGFAPRIIVLLASHTKKEIEELDSDGLEELLKFHREAAFNAGKRLHAAFADAAHRCLIQEDEEYEDDSSVDGKDSILDGDSQALVGDFYAFITAILKHNPALCLIQFTLNKKNGKENDGTSLIQAMFSWHFGPEDRDEVADLGIKQSGGVLDCMSGSMKLFARLPISFQVRRQNELYLARGKDSPRRHDLHKATQTAWSRTMMSLINDDFSWLASEYIYFGPEGHKEKKHKIQGVTPTRVRRRFEMDDLWLGTLTSAIKYNII